MVALSKSVGRMAMGPGHDVAVVQAALANIKAGMKPYWSRPIDGRKTRELEEAIACFQVANKITPNGKVDTFGPTINALKRLLPANMRGLRGVPGTIAVCVATTGAQDAEREARDAKAKAPFPNKEASGLATVITTVGKAFSLCLERKREFVTPDGRFAVDLDFTGVRWLDNRSARLLPPGQEPRAVINAVCSLINKVPEWEVGSPNDLVLKSKRQIAALKGTAQASIADLKTLGLAQMPQNAVLKTIVAACARLFNSGALGTRQGKQDHALLIEAATGADAGLAQKLKADASTSGPKIYFAVNVDPASLTSYSRGVLLDVMRASGIGSLLITSTFRTPQEQARVMFDQIDRRGETVARRLYNATAEKVLDVYVSLKPTGASDQDITDAMAAEILRLRTIDSNSFRHVADPNILNTIDIAPSSLPAGKQSTFIQAIGNDRRVSRFFHPPVDEAFHIEIPQP